MKQLNLPFTEEAPLDLDDWFLCRPRMPRGISLLQRMDGSYYWARFPAQTELEACKRFYLGGHTYPLSSTEESELVAAGFSEYISDYTPPGSYGWGLYGAGDYGYGEERM